MAKTIVGLFTSLDDAQSAANELMVNGVGAREINFVTPDGEQTHPGQARIGAELGDERREEIGKGAATGGLAGGAIGGAAALFAAGAGIAIPGLGAVLVAGPILGALAGAGVGIAAGGIIGALTHMGVPEHEAHYYAEGVRRGGTLMMVSSDSDTMAMRAVDIMDRRGAINVEELAISLHEEGWSGFMVPSVEVEEFERRGRRRPVTASESAGAGGGISFGEAAREMRATPSGNRVRGARYIGPERRRVNDPFYAGPERRQAMAS